METYEARCLCGGVRLSVTPPSLFFVHCHCRFCRAAHGAPVVSWVGVPDEQFAIQAGHDLLTWHRSSKQGRRAFCSRCGTTLLYVSTLSPGEVHVARACIAGEIDREPQAHVFTDHAVPWLELGGDVKRLTSDSGPLKKYRDVEE